MKAFIFEYIDQVSDNYHCGGGLVVIAKDKDHVNELIADDEDIHITENEWEKVKVYELSAAETKPTYYVFPDAGCC